MTGEPLLIVDDTPLNLTLLEVVLERAGYEVRTAGDAPTALAVLAAFQPRLILLDLQLPGMNGLELTRRLKAAAATRAILVVAVTSSSWDDDVENARAAGCDGYLTKPIDTRALPRLVAGYLDGSVPSWNASLADPPRS